MFLTTKEKQTRFRFSLLASRFSLFVFSFLVFLLSSNDSAQVIIKEKVEINPQKILIPESGLFPIDEIFCNKFVQNRELKIKTGLDTTISVWYGDCMDPFYGGECVFFFDIRGPWDVLIEECFQYIRPRRATGDCIENPYIDEDENFNINEYNCLYLNFDKLEPAISAMVRIKFTFGGQNGTEFCYYTFNVFKPEWHIAQTDSFVVLEYGDYKALNDYEILTQCNSEWPFLPESSVITKEIVQGSEYGQLWNSYTNEYSNAFNDGDIYLVANGVKPEQDEEIVVRVSTNVAGVAPLDLIYIVRPVDIEVTITPPTISAGDTAVITLQKKYTDGTIVNFDEGQTFNIAKIDGCILGDLLVEGVTGPYFPYIYQPFRFVADSSANTGSVKIKIGVPKYPSFGSRPIRIDDITPKQTDEAIKNDKQKTQENLEPQPNGQMNNLELTCSPELINEPFNVEANVVVGNECNDYPCDQGYVYSSPRIVSKLEDIIWSNSFTNEHGTKVFSGLKGGETFILFDDKFYVNGYPIKDELVQNFQIEPCFKDNNWQFFIATAGDNNEIKLKVYVALYDWGYPNDIDNINELNIIPENENCLALKDFEKHRPYRFNENYPGFEPPPSIDKYFIKDATINHEKVHVKFFQLDIKEALKIKIKHYGALKTFKEHLKFTPVCTSIFNNKENSRFQATKYYNLLLKEFVKKLQIVNKSRFPDNRTEENKTQWNDDVQSTIDYYQSKLIKYWKSQGKPIRNCDLKEFDWSAYTQYKNKI